MPVGGGKFANDLRTMLQSKLGAAMESAKAKIEKEVDDMVAEIDANAEASVKKIRAEAREAVSAFDDILGNERPETGANPTGRASGET